MEKKKYDEDMESIRPVRCPFIESEPTWEEIAVMSLEELDHVSPFTL